MVLFVVASMHMNVGIIIASSISEGKQAILSQALYSAVMGLGSRLMAH
jgi:hypothetical protein